MDGNRHDAIRARAYEIWEAEGFPVGRDRQHWEQASHEIDEARTEAAAEAERR